MNEWRMTNDESATGFANLTPDFSDQERDDLVQQGYAVLGGSNFRPRQYQPWVSRADPTAILRKRA